MGCHFLLQEIFLTQGLNPGSQSDASLVSPAGEFFTTEPCSGYRSPQTHRQQRSQGREKQRLATASSVNQALLGAKYRAGSSLGIVVSSSHSGWQREGVCFFNFFPNKVETLAQRGQITCLKSHKRFPGSSALKESTCNAGDPGLIPRLGRPPGEGIGYLLQYPWSSLVVQMVKNMHAMWETWVQSLGWEDLLEEGMATHSSIIAWRIPTDRGAWWATDHGVTKSQTQLSD